MKAIEVNMSEVKNNIAQSIGPINTGGILGIVGMAVTLILLENRRIPAAVLVVFGGILLGLMIRDLTERQDVFVALIILCNALTTNLAAAFICGIIIAYALKSEKINM